ELGAVKSLSASTGDLGAHPDCDATHVWVTAQAPGYDSALRVVTVQVKRPFEITHANHTVSLQPGEDSHAFQGTTVGGPWLLRTPLAAGEVCHSGTLPKSLEIELVTECKATR